MRMARTVTCLVLPWVASLASMSIAQSVPDPAPRAAGLLPPGDGTASADNLDLLTGRDVLLTLDSGEVFRGRLLGHGGGTVSIRNQFAGEFDVPAERIRQAVAHEPPSPTPVPPPPPLVSTPVEQSLGPTADITPVTRPPEVTPVPDAGSASQANTAQAQQPPTPLWEKQEYHVEGGFAGTEGNTRRSNLRFGGVARLSRPDDILTLEGRYLTTRERERTTQERVELRGRNDWISTESPWQFFVEGSAELDRFREYDALVRGGGGVGYRLLQTDRTSLVARLGAGFSRKFGSNDESVRPEGILGLDFSRRFRDADSLVINAEAFPLLEELDRYRTRTRAYYEIRLSERVNVNLRLGVEHRYESDPGRREHSDLDYAATIVVKF